MSLPTIEEFPLEQVENFTEDQLRDFIEITYCGNDRRSSTRFFPIPTSIKKIDFKQQKNYGKLRGIYKFAFGLREYNEPEVIENVFSQFQSYYFALCLCDCGKWNVVEYNKLYCNGSRSCGDCKPLGCNIEDFKEKKVGRFDITCTRFEKIYDNIYDVFEELGAKDNVEQREIFDKIITRLRINGFHFLFLDDDGNIDDKNTERHRLSLSSYRKNNLRFAKLDWKGKIIKIYDKHEDFTSNYEHCGARLCVSYSPFFDFPTTPCQGKDFWRYVDENGNILNYQDIFPFLKYDITDNTSVVKQDLKGKIIEYYNNLEDCALKEPFSKDVIEICCKAGNLFLNDITYSFYDKEKEFVIPTNHWSCNKKGVWTFLKHPIKTIKLDDYGLPYKFFDLCLNRVGYSDKIKTYYRRIEDNGKLQIFTTKDFKCNIDYVKYQHKKIGATVSKRVAQIDIDTGKVLKIYPSISEAEREIGCYGAYISLVCRGKKRETAGGFIWRYVDEDDNIINPTSNSKILKTAFCRGRPVVKLTLDGEELDRYPSIAEAARKNGYIKSVAAAAISNVCSGKKSSYYGFKWKYAEEVDKKDE